MFYSWSLFCLTPEFSILAMLNMFIKMLFEITIGHRSKTRQSCWSWFLASRKYTWGHFSTGHTFQGWRQTKFLFEPIAHSPSHVAERLKTPARREHPKLITDLLWKKPTKHEEFHSHSGNITATLIPWVFTNFLHIKKLFFPLDVEEESGRNRKKMLEKSRLYEMNIKAKEKQLFPLSLFLSSPEFSQHLSLWLGLTGGSGVPKIWLSGHSLWVHGY